MSWYKRTPKVKEPSKTLPEWSSPTSEKLFNEIKERAQSTDKKRPKKK